MNHKIIPNDNRDRLLQVAAAACFIYAIWFAIAYCNQPLLDRHSFRQTQTALSTYWLGKNGFSLAYETPVAGYPWSIPFEFPLYQYLVSIVSDATGSSLETTGRLISFTFMLACLYPCHAIFKRFNFEKTTYLIFAILYLSSPVYLYWGRSFMIETAALFFTLMSIRYYLDILYDNCSYLGFGIFASMGMLQKVTTTLPVLAILFSVFILTKAHALWRNREVGGQLNVSFMHSVKLSASFAAPILIGLAWVHYTDQVKSLNDFGRQLTSSALSNWNWGTLDQRYSHKLWVDVLTDRIFKTNMTGALGLLILGWGLYAKSGRAKKVALISTLAMGLLPLFAFSNLHIIHDYYQTSLLIFFIAALAFSFDNLTQKSSTRIISLILVLLLAFSNYKHFRAEYFKEAERKYDASNSREIAVAETLRAKVPKDKFVVVFGNDWSSSIAYLSERKTFTVPQWYHRYNEIIGNPSLAFPPGTLGGVVFCPERDTPSPSQLSGSFNNSEWIALKVAGCQIEISASPSEKRPN